MPPRGSDDDNDKVLVTLRQEERGGGAPGPKRRKYRKNSEQSCWTVCLPEVRLRIGGCFDFSLSFVQPDRYRHGGAKEAKLQQLRDLVLTANGGYPSQRLLLLPPLTFAAAKDLDPTGRVWIHYELRSDSTSALMIGVCLATGRPVAITKLLYRKGTMAKVSKEITNMRETIAMNDDDRSGGGGGVSSGLLGLLDS
jgi:hypothetical protein